MIRKLTMLALVFGSLAYADSFFWAINQFTTIQKLNGDTGAVVDSFAMPSPGGFGASVAVIGTTAYYTKLFDSSVYKTDINTHADLGFAFNTGNANWMNGITVDENNHLWFAHGDSDSLQEFDTAGNLLGTFSFPDAADAYRDGSTVNGGFLVANRGDQEGPYDKYKINGNGTLTYVAQPFITAFGGNNGIAFNGVNYYVSNEQTHIVSKYDVNGVFVSQANLPANSRYENWTFASQDIVPQVPEPAAIVLLGTMVLGLAPVLRRRRAA